MKTEDSDVKQDKKFTLKERLKDKRERAKIELILYGIFFLGVIIFVRIIGSMSSGIEDSNIEKESFIFTISDNYEYDMVINKNDNIYEYYGKVLGNNSTINLRETDKEKTYYFTNKKYYALKDNEYILTSEEEVYPYIDYYYLSVDNIKEYIHMATKEGEVYKLKLSDIVLNNNSEDYVEIFINEGDKNIVIDYTALFKLMDQDIDKLLVNITYSNINNIISLGE